jgi:WD40 repeat protein
VKIWDIEATRATGITQKKERGLEDIPCSLAISPDGRLVAAGQGQEDFTISIFDARTGQVTGTITPPSRPEYSKFLAVAWSPNSKLLACADGGHIVRIWDVKKLQEAMAALFQAEDFKYHCMQSVAFSPDSKLLAIGGNAIGNDYGVWLWDLVNNRQLYRLAIPLCPGSCKKATCITWSPDGKYVASGVESFGCSVRIWDATRGLKEVTHVLEGHTNIISKVSYSLDGKLLASGSEHDKGIKIWDAASGREVMEPLKGNSFSWVRVANDISPLEQRYYSGYYIATADVDQVLVYRLQVGANFLALWLFQLV